MAILRADLVVFDLSVIQVCRCACHSADDNKKAENNPPCCDCQPCPRCSRFIKTGSMEEHLVVCKTDKVGKEE